MRRVFDSAASDDATRGCGIARVAFPLSGQGRHTEVVISELNGWPACTPVNASAGASPPPPHDSGPVWLAGPSPYGSFIRYSMPVYPGAFPDPKCCSAAPCLIGRALR